MARLRAKYATVRVAASSEPAYATIHEEPDIMAHTAVSAANNDSSEFI